METLLEFVEMFFSYSLPLTRVNGKQPPKVQKDIQ